ncbi:MAG: recombination protein F [Erythrobacter sp.]
MFFTSDVSNKLFAAIGSLALSAAVMAATIIPASPAGLFA